MVSNRFMLTSKPEAWQILGLFSLQLRPSEFIGRNGMLPWQALMKSSYAVN